MRFLRFSIRRLLFLTGLVAVLLYVFYVRPTSLAQQFAVELDAATKSHLKVIGQEYLDKLRSDGRVIELKLHERSWSDVVRGRQLFSVSTVVESQPEWSPTTKFFSTRSYQARISGVKEVGQVVFEVREGDLNARAN